MKKRILIVDDNLQISRVLQKHLTVVGFDVVLVDNGLSMLDKLLDENFDLVISDLAMPEGDGATAINIMRKIKINLPVLVYSAWTDDTHLPDDVVILKKPLPLMDVVARVQELIQD